MIIHTSGTGGAPRGVMLSHGAILSNCMGGAVALDRRARARVHVGRDLHERHELMPRRLLHAVGDEPRLVLERAQHRPHHPLAALGRSGDVVRVGGISESDHLAVDRRAALLRVLEPYGIRELAQSGTVAMTRGGRSMTDRTLRAAERSA